jgi:hypothetical protein
LFGSSRVLRADRLVRLFGLGKLGRLLRNIRDDNNRGLARVDRLGGLRVSRRAGRRILSV